MPLRKPSTACVRDFVQGMTIWLQKAVEVGAHVRIGDYEGDVLGVDWRATRLGVADDAVVSFLDIAPATPGHALVVPRAHRRDLWEIDDVKHVQGIKGHPEEYERRVIGFFDEALFDGVPAAGE